MSLSKTITSYVPSTAHVESFGNVHAFEVSAGDIVGLCEKLKRSGLSLKMISASDERSDSGTFHVRYVFGVPKLNEFLVPFIKVKESFPSLTTVLHEASVYERKIFSLFGLIPDGHPNLRSLILHENWPSRIFPLRKDVAWNTRPPEAHEMFEFHKVEGDGIYEIPVGPVHAGIIEPGHFRFSVAGEEILWLEPRLGYSHKGTEKLFEVLPLADKVRLAERISGDSSFSHSLAFCQGLENLYGVKVPEKAKYLRLIYAELERIANHFGDIGAIMTDTGFTFGGAQGGRLREVVLQWNERLTGSRFLRGVNVPGGVEKNISDVDVKALREAVIAWRKDFGEVMAIAGNSSSVLNRLKGTGVLDRQIAEDHGVVGVPARAVGLQHDARIDYPYAAYGYCKLSVATHLDGDVYARFQVRVEEVYTSCLLLEQALSSMSTGGEIRHQVKESFARSNHIAVGIVEGWRGDIVYLISTDKTGMITRVDVRDPSFLNWTVVGHAGKGNMVPDFPLINKSFNLSYSGNDL